MTCEISTAIIVALETVASATIIDLRFSMSKFMKLLNNISRSQAIYRHSKISADDLQSCHYAFVLTICREPGRSQEEIAKEPYFECVSLSGLPLDLYNDYIGGEIRLAYYHDGEKKVPVTGISMSGKLSEVLNTLRLAEKVAQKDNYQGPEKALLKNISII